MPSSPSLASPSPPPRPPEQDDAVTLAARAKLWEAGDLTWKLDRGRPTGPQRDFYEKAKRSKRKTFVNEWARRVGKSFALGIIGGETALRNPGCRINWFQNTSTSVKKSAVATLNKIFRDAPPEYRGEFNTQQGAFCFPNGSKIYIFGANTQDDADMARGGDDPLLTIVDEAGFMDWLKYLLKSVVRPGMRLVKRGPHIGRSHCAMVLVASSTPKDPEHHFVELADINEVLGSYIKKTIYDTEEPEAEIAEAAQEDGLTVEQYKETEAFQREMLCIRVVLAEAVVFPSFHRKKDLIVREWTRPIGFEKYVQKRMSLDLGGGSRKSDKCGLLFGYVDFFAAKVVIEDELLLTKPNTKQLADAIKETEEKLWPEAEPNRTSRVIDDPDGRTVLDLWELFKVSTQKATKNDRDASIRMVDTLMQGERLIINPRCIQLRAQLLKAKKTKQGNDFDRSEEHSHFDLCASIMYFVRDISLTSNPYPADFDVIAGRKKPAHHPIVSRQVAMGVEQGSSLKRALTSGGRFVSTRRKFGR